MSAHIFIDFVNDENTTQIVGTDTLVLYLQALAWKAAASRLLAAKVFVVVATDATDMADMNCQHKVSTGHSELWQTPHVMREMSVHHPRPKWT